MSQLSESVSGNVINDDKPGTMMRATREPAIGGESVV
jgi:hypothetical protein